MGAHLSERGISPGRAVGNGVVPWPSWLVGYEAADVMVVY